MVKELIKRQENNAQDAFKQDIPTRALNDKAVYLDGKLVTDPDVFPADIQNSYMPELIAKANEKLYQLFPDDDVIVSHSLVSGKTIDFTYCFSTDPIKLKLVLSNIGYYDVSSDNQYLIPGEVAFELERIDNDTYQLNEIILSSTFKQQLKFTVATHTLQKTLDLPIPSNYVNTQKSLVEYFHTAANDILSKVTAAQKHTPEHTNMYAELLEATNGLLQKPFEDKPRNVFSSALSKIKQIDSRWAGPVMGAGMFMLGSSIIVGAMLSSGPAGIGALGLLVAAKLLKIFVAKHVILATISAASMMGSILPVLFFGSPSSVRAVDDAATVLQNKLDENSTIEGAAPS